MSRRPLMIARGIGLVVLPALALAGYQLHPMLGLGLFIAAALGIAGYLLRDDLARGLVAVMGFLGRPVGWFGLALLGTWIVTAPAILFFDPANFDWTQQGHIARNPLDFYLIVSDDVAYVGASRTWDRTVSNLLAPHNTHIVPAWRLLTYALVVCAGNLQGLPHVLAVAAYGALIAVMLMVGRLVARETGSSGLGLAASAMVGTTSLMLTPGVWYSGSQPLWASIASLSALRYAQSYRRNGCWRYLVFSSLSASVAGGMWAAGHLAGPVTAVYLWFDGRRRCRLAAAVPLLATALTVVLFLTMATRPMDSRVSFHGRTVREAANPVQGAVLTAQAIPENLILANLGLNSETTPLQGIVLTLGLLALWLSRRWRPAGGDRPWPALAFNPLESAGVALVLGCYLLEWTFRGYFQSENLRSISPYVIVPWYDVIPQVGAVLFVTGWWSGPHRPGGTARRPADCRTARPLRSTALMIATAALALVALNRPRVDALFRGTVPLPVASEQAFFRIPRLLTLRAAEIFSERVAWQRRYLRRLDQAEAVARRLGIGREGIRAAFDFVFIPGATSRILREQREHYDVAGLLDIPARGRLDDPEAIRAALGPLLIPGPEPRPRWLAPNEVWPPQ